MAKLINGNGNPAIYASQDADLIASLSGNTTSIAAVGNEFTATQEDANTIGLADGVIITQEGRRIQLDDGDTDLFTIPTGTAGTTSYYIIGYKLSTQADSSQTCETFVQKMNSSSETITEDTFKGGATDVYVSCYRVTQDGLNIDSINLLLPKLGNISELKSDLSAKALVNTYYDTTAKKLYVVNADGTKGAEIPMNKNLNYTTPLWESSTNLSYTPSTNCYLVGAVNGTNAWLKIRDKAYANTYSNDDHVFISLPLTSGDKVEVSWAMNGNVKVLAYK